MLLPNNRMREFENLFGTVVPEESAPTPAGVHIHVDHLSDQQAALFAFGQNLRAEDAACYMQQLLTSAPAPAPTALPAPAPAPADDDDDILVDIAQVVNDQIQRAIPSIAEAINLSNAKAAKVSALEGAFATAVAANPADAVTLANKLATAKSKVEAATTISEVNAVKL